MSEHILRVLVVDDEKSIREPLVERLQRFYGYHVDSAASGQQAVRLINRAEGRYDVAVIDQILRGRLNGLEVLRRIKNKWPDIQVIVITGWEDEMKKEGLNVLREGAYRYIAKPLNLDELALTIQFASEETHSRQERRYMAALVGVSQGLTYTTQQDLQLKYAWDFVREQLDVSTFFIGLYDPVTRKISFPIAYDMGEPLQLPDTNMAASRREWGLAGHVIDSRDEILWSTINESAKTCKDKKINRIVLGQPSASCYSIPLRLGDKMLGVLSAQSYRSHVFTPVVRNALKALGSQLSVALENSRLFDDIGQKAKDLEQKSISLSALQELALTINASLEKGRIFTETCKAAVEFFRCDHSALVLFDDKLDTGIVEAEYPDLNVKNVQIPLRNVEAEERLKTLHEPLVFYDVQLEESLGPVREIMAGLGLKSTMIIPVIGKKRLWGSFSLDTIHRHRAFQPEEIALCKAFADHVAVAIDNAYLFSELNRTREQLDALVENSFDAVIAIDQDRKILVFNRRAEEMFGWTSEEMLRQSAARLHTDIEKAREIYELVNREGIINGWRVELKHKDGTKIPALLSVTLIRDNNGMPIGQAGFIHNLREIKIREQLLTTLDEISRHVRAEKEPANLLNEIARLAGQLVNCNVGGLLINHPNLQELEVAATYGLEGDLKNTRLSYTGLMGKVALTGIHQIVTGYSSWPEREDLFDQFGFETLIGLPLKHLGRVEAILFVADAVPQRTFDKNDIEMLDRFAAQASIALHTSQLMGKEQRQVGQLSILHRISDYVQEAQDLDKILHVVLTGVTAGYGLGFNRAALLLLDRTGTVLEGKMGIGYLSEAEARKDWDLHEKQGLEDFGNYLKALENNTLKPSPIEKEISKVRIPVRLEQSDLLSLAVQQKRLILVSDGEHIFPEEFSMVFEPAMPFAIIPMMARGKVIGLLVVDNKFTHAPLTPDAMETLVTFANSAAVAVSNMQLFQEASLAREKISASFEASNTLVLYQPTIKLMENIIYQAQQVAGASWASIVLIDELGLASSLFTTGSDSLVDMREVIRPDGISMQVMRNGRIKEIKDTLALADLVNPKMFQNGVAAALCLPFAVQGRRIGVVWMHYDTPQDFPEHEIEAVQLFVNQSAVAYDNARRIAELENLHTAAKAMASVAEPGEVLRQIVKSAREVLGASCTLIWSYDQMRNIFISEELVAENMPDEWLEKFRQEEPRTGRTTRHVIETGYVEFTNLGKDKSDLLGMSTRVSLRELGVKSFQSIRLDVAGEILGVLYVDYDRERAFDAENRKLLENFSNHAALALKKARLLDQVKQARNAAVVVAEVMTLETEHENLWKSIVVGAKKSLGCDAVTLYRFNEDTGELGYPPAMEGVDFPEKVFVKPRVPDRSIVWQIIESQEMVIIDDADKHELTQGRRFKNEERIKSMIAIPLRVGSRKMGAMFINYRHKHHFTSDERKNISLFANQAAVAIRNAQLHLDVKKRVKTMDALYEAGRIITQSLSLQDTLDRISEETQQIIGVDRIDGCFSHIALLEENQLLFSSAFPKDILASLQNSVKIDLRHSSRIGITGRAAELRQLQNIGNVHDPEEQDYIEAKPQINSQLSVPIMVGEQVIGVLTIEHPHMNAFSSDDEKNVTLLAAQAGVAIENARLFEKNVVRLREQESLVKLSKELLGPTDLKDVLDRAVTVAAEVLHMEFCDIVLSDDDGDLIMRSAVGWMEDLIGSYKFPTGSGSQSGYTILHRQPIIVEDYSIEKRFDVPAIVSDHQIRSGMSVPIFQGHKVAGAMLVHTRSHRSFTDSEIDLFSLIANQTAIAIQNAQRFEELRTMRALVGPRTATEWMRMVSMEWGHAIKRESGLAMRYLELIRQEIAAGEIEQANEDLKKIGTVVERIKEIPIVAPLSREDKIMPVSVNELIQTHVERMWQHDSYKSARLVWNLQPDLDTIAVVVASPQWLLRCVEIFLDNAIHAMLDSGRLPRRIEITTLAVRQKVQVLIKDSGPGFPRDLSLGTIGIEPVRKEIGSRGAGLGLVLAKTIAQTYGGDITVVSTGPGGTTMGILLPLKAV